MSQKSVFLVILALSLSNSFVNAQESKARQDQQSLALDNNLEQQPEQVDNDFLADDTTEAERITVTGTRQAQSVFDSDSSIGYLSEQELEDINPKHAADALNRIPGVYIAQLGSTGEGAAAAIRQPISYGPSYLYLENGVPVRSAAFFNHNALYAMNIPQASGVEVIKGPGTALYGSDAIGGVVNVRVGETPNHSKQKLRLQSSNYERNEFNYQGAFAGENGNYNLRTAVVDDAGWRDNTQMNRQSMVFSFESALGANWQQLSWLTINQLDLNTGGSGLAFSDFKNDPSQAGNQIGFREVLSVRFATKLSYATDESELIFIPYARSNSLEYMATWTLNTGREVFIPWLNSTVLDSQDAHINESGHDSIGFITQYRQNLGGAEGFWIIGADTEYSQGDQIQTYIVRTDTDPGDYWLSFERQDALYDYRVNYTAYSPFFHLEWQFADAWRVNMGLRYDYGRYDYDNRLTDVLSDSLHNRPADQSLSMRHTSPKIGLIFDINDSHNLYASLRTAFRIPGAYQLFRAGATVDSTKLNPVKADNAELGIRGNLHDSLSYELAAYQLSVEDDILSYTDPVTGARFNTNAGETRHKGVELGVQWSLSQSLSSQLRYTRATHDYTQWRVAEDTDFSGNQMPNAPEYLLGLVVDYEPQWLEGAYFSLEWQRYGRSFIDEANLLTADGYNLTHMRAHYDYSDRIQWFAQIMNAGDVLYAETTSKWGPSYTPGRPRSVFLGLTWRL